VTATVVQLFKPCPLRKNRSFDIFFAKTIYCFLFLTAGYYLKQPKENL